MSARPHWHGDKRDDGVSVYSFPAPASGGRLWAIDAPDHATITFCPCCGEPVRTREAAQRIADAVYPPTVGRDE